MKRVIITLTGLLAISLLSSCATIQPVYKPDKSFRQWTGEVCFEGFVAGIIWVKPIVGVPGKQAPYKIFLPEEWDLIMSRLCNPEEYGDYSSLAGDPAAEKLRVFFLNGREPVEISFYLDKKAERLIIPRGGSPSLYYLFAKKEVCELYRVPQPSISEPR